MGNGILLLLKRLFPILFACQEPNLFENQNRLYPCTKLSQSAHPKTRRERFYVVVDEQTVQDVVWLDVRSSTCIPISSVKLTRSIAGQGSEKL